MRVTTTMKMPALAVVGPDRQIVRSTETFRRRYEDVDKMCEASAELDQVLTGQADVATLTLGDLNVEIEAVTDATGRRQAMLTLPPAELVPAVETPVSALREAAEDSKAMVWVKDLEGRYLFANPRFYSELRTWEQRLLGKTDRELRELETVDGPRLRYAEDGLKEPLQLEYTVPAIDHRPALAVFRFPLRDANDQPVATCGVAAPVAETPMARAEVVRLMQLERWNRLDPVAVRAEVLEQWHVHTAMALDSEPAPQAEEAPTSPTWEVVAEHDEAPGQVSRPTEASAATPPAPSPTPPPEPALPSLSETAELLQTNLKLARQWADRAQDLQAELQEAKAAAARAAEDADRSRVELEQTQAELERTQAELADTRVEVEQMLARMRSALTEFESASAGAQASV